MDLWLQPVILAIISIPDRQVTRTSHAKLVGLEPALNGMSMINWSVTVLSVLEEVDSSIWRSVRREADSRLRMIKVWRNRSFQVEWYGLGCMLCKPGNYPNAKVLIVPCCRSWIAQLNHKSLLNPIHFPKLLLLRTVVRDHEHDHVNITRLNHSQHINHFT